MEDKCRLSKCFYLIFKGLLNAYIYIYITMYFVVGFFLIMWCMLYEISCAFNFQCFIPRIQLRRKLGHPTPNVFLSTRISRQYLNIVKEFFYFFSVAILQRYCKSPFKCKGFHFVNVLCDTSHRYRYCVAF